MDLVRTREIYVNVCMNSFVIDIQALWSTVGLNENDNPKCKSDVEGALYLHFRDNCRFIHGILKGLCGRKESLNHANSRRTEFFFVQPTTRARFAEWTAFSNSFSLAKINEYVLAIVQTDKCDLRIHRVTVSVQNKRPKNWFFFSMIWIQRVKLTHINAINAST